MGKAAPKARKKVTAASKAAGIATPAADERSLQLFDFAKSFFTYLDCTLTQEGSRLNIKLSEKAKTQLGLTDDELALRFSLKDVAEDTSPSTSFVQGSKLFEAAVRKMSQDGFYTQVSIPPQHATVADVTTLIKKWSPNWTWVDKVEPLEAENDFVRYYLFNFRVTFRSDARKDVIHTLVTDGAGRAFPELVPLFSELMRTRKANFHSVTEGSGTMHGIKAASYRAEKDVTFWADREGMEMEKEVLPRLHKVVADLTAHYGARVSELEKDEGTPADLKAELAQKIAEEVAKHALIVGIELVNFACVFGPATKFGFKLRRGDAVVQLRNWYDLTRDAVNPAYCAVCAENDPEHATEPRAFTVCAGGHLSCERCTIKCGEKDCERVLCSRHGGYTCKECSKSHSVCGLHGIACDCGRQLCKPKTSNCQLCNGAKCPKCLTTCQVNSCGKRLCAADFAVCYTCDKQTCRGHLIDCKYNHRVCSEHIKSVNGEAVCTKCVSSPPKMNVSLGNRTQRSLEEVADEVAPAGLLSGFDKSRSRSS